MRNFFIIKKRKKILECKRFKKKVINNYFSIHYNPSTSCNLLIVNTKKNCRSSVKRNLLKRRIKEIINEHNKTHNLYFDIVIYSKQSAFTSDFISIKKELRFLLNKIV